MRDILGFLGLVAILLFSWLIMFPILWDARRDSSHRSCGPALIVFIGLVEWCLILSFAGAYALVRLL